jgi:diadenylate cyclase
MTWLTAVLRRPPISWWDIADIAVVSLIIYELLMLIRGTRAVQMALGGAVVVGLFYLSGLSHLETVNFLIRNFVGYVVFAIIVLFQADIRRALAHLGRAPFFRYFATDESAEESIEELIVAAGLLSAKRIGAIVAIERQVGLRNYIEGGIPLDGVLTYDLLVSIFQPSSPLHDGAVIVQNDRIASAACFLPLTVNPRLSKELGSRHRAAIGLTEENDSIAIVVSEETGIISVVVDGRVERGFDPDALRARLQALLIRNASSTRRKAPVPEMAGRV